MSISGKFTTKIEFPDNMYIDRKRFQKMMFITNAIENGWHVRKRRNSYVFSKKHGGRREIFMDEYLELFIDNHSAVDLDIVPDRVL